MILRGMERKGCSGHEAGRLLLADMYRQYSGSELPSILVTDRGKPYFADGKLHFSITHTKKHVFCALSEKPVGIDAEELDREIDLRLAQKILSSGELAQWEAASDQRLALLTFWVLKEAAAKCTGEGLRGYPNRTDFSMDDPRVQKMYTCLVAVVEE